MFSSWRVIVWLFAMGVTVVAIVNGAFTSSSRSTGSTSTTRRVITSTVPPTTVTPYLTTTTAAPTTSTGPSSGPVKLTDGVTAAERQVEAALGPMGPLLAVSTTGTLGVDVAPPSVPTLGAPAAQWVFQFLASSTPGLGGTEALVRSVSVGPAGVIDHGTTTITYPARSNVPETMSAAWPTALERASRRVLTADRLAQPLRVSWVCDPAPGEADCRWVFHFGPTGADLVFVNTAGDTLTPRPSWYRDALG